MSRTVLTGVALTLAVGVVALGAAGATNAAERVRVRGTIEKLDGNTLTVKGRDGKDVMVMLNTDWKVTGVMKASVTDIKPGDFVGIASQATDSGINGAIEVVIFPPAMKGTGEGDRPWEKPNTSMTNATVANAVKSVNGPTLTLAFQGKEKKINIPDGTPVVTLGPATKDDLKSGAGVFIMGEGAGDGMVSSNRVAVGINGTVPPM